MNHGQFDKSDQLVAAVHRAEGGIFAGFRAAHAFGRFYAGTFTATPAAKTLSRAAHFQGTPVPVTARLSGASGDPSKKPSNVVAMATKFYLPDGTATDLIGITLPAFFARTPEEFLAFAAAHTADPATGQVDLAKLKAFMMAHPNGGRVILLLQNQPAVVSFAQVSYRPLHTYSLRECRRRRPLGALSLGTGSRRRRPAARGTGEAAARLLVRGARRAPAHRSGRVPTRAGARSGGRPGRRPVRHLAGGSRARRRGTARTVPADHRRGDRRPGDDARPDGRHGRHRGLA